VEEWEKAVERREREIRKREKVAELEQAIDKQERALGQRGSELEERYNGLKCSRKNGNTFRSTWWGTCPLRHLVRIRGPLLFFGLSFSVY